MARALWHTFGGMELRKLVCGNRKMITKDMKKKVESTNENVTSIEFCALDGACIRI